MKTLAFSDLHRDVEAAQKILTASKDADVLVGAGDFATKTIGAAETLNILAKCKKPVVIVHGNHDNPTEIAEFCQAHQTLHYLHGQSISLTARHSLAWAVKSHPETHLHGMPLKQKTQPAKC